MRNRNRNITKFIIVNLLTLPLNIIVAILSIVYVIGIRSNIRAKKINTFIEAQEKAKKKN